ncbi:MAG: helix-turn-helix transcriptional regulator [Clostridia bacterium]|nr:helix-turn-helix transcriptional regulator [Clostridia bacterium]
MQFNEKLQDLRKQKGLTQDQLAEMLFVSRTAVSKWESGRGTPNIESLKAIAKLFSVSIDELLSGEQLLCLAEEDNKQKQKHFRDVVFGLLDISVLLFLFLPLFAYKTDEVIRDVSLLNVTTTAPWLKIAYFAVVIITVLFGVLTLSLQNYNGAFWVKNKSIISLIISAIGALLFIISLQPYAAVFLFVFLIIKVMILNVSRV